MIAVVVIVVIVVIRRQLSPLSADIGGYENERRIGCHRTCLSLSDSTAVCLTNSDSRSSTLPLPLQTCHLDNAWPPLEPRSHSPLLLLSTA